MGEETAGRCLAVVIVDWLLGSSSEPSFATKSLGVSSGKLQLQCSSHVALKVLTYQNFLRPHHLGHILEPSRLPGVAGYRLLGTTKVPDPQRQRAKEHDDAPDSPR